MPLESLEETIRIQHLSSNIFNSSTGPRKRNVPTQLFEALAKNTWETLRHSTQLGLSQGEETITDNNLLAIRVSGVKAVRVWKCPKSEEAEKGIDWEWFIGSDKMGWLRYSVQAKKIYFNKRGSYKIKHKVKGQLQLEILKEYAELKSAIPLYCFYNFREHLSYDNFWHCPLDCEPDQLGCTITPLKVVEEAQSIKGRSCFHFIHSNTNTIPWRCLVGCNHVLDAYKQQEMSDQHPFGEFKVYPTIPLEVRELFNADQKPNPTSSPGYVFSPARLMIAELDDVDRNSRFKSDVPPLPILKKF